MKFIRAFCAKTIREGGVQYVFATIPSPEYKWVCQSQIARRRFKTCEAFKYWATQISFAGFRYQASSKSINLFSISQRSWFCRLVFGPAISVIRRVSPKLNEHRGLRKHHGLSNIHCRNLPVSANQLLAFHPDEMVCHYCKSVTIVIKYLSPEFS